MTANNVSIWTTILSIPAIAAWYLDHIKAITLPAGWNEPLLGIAVALVIAALIANAVSHITVKRQPLGHQSQSTGSTNASAATTTQFKNVDEFYQTYSSRMLTETEALVKAESNQYPEQDRERYLTRLAAMLVTVLIFERVWLSSYGSQLKALKDLNTDGMKTYEKLRAYYEDAAKRYPDHYKSVTFEMWVGFLKSWLLIREHDLTHLEITVRGQDFLKYLVEVRYNPELRAG